MQLRAEAVIEHAQAALRTAVGALNEEFEVQTLEAADRVRKELEEELQVLLSHIEVELRGLAT